MPEGPECRTFALGLAKAISYKTLTKVSVLSGKYTRTAPIGFDSLIKKLPIEMIGSGVHGKYIYALGKKDQLIISFTMGMTGNFSIEQQKHSRLKLDFGDGSSVFYNDMRNFGTVRFDFGKEYLINKLQNLGPDMLIEDLSDQNFVTLLRAKNKWNICKAIMDQSVIAGVGNYIKADSLWLAKINPRVTVADLDDGHLALLNRSIKKVIKASFEDGGATFKSYSDINGQIGNYSQRFLVYNQKCDPEGNTVEKIKTPDGRTTHWSPKVQIHGENYEV
tara:strand:+ start:633 stop:1463 length:831 start_codon:yes stop_codon:yes gene_type:complete